MMRRIMAVLGVPGSGKTYLMRKFMLYTSNVWKRVNPEKLVYAEYSPRQNVHVLGKYDEGEVFAGTDKLSMGVQPKALQFIKDNANLSLVFEGDRLGNRSFLTELTTMPNTKLRILVLQTNLPLLQLRYKHRESEQSTTFLKSRNTKIKNIVEDPLLQQYIKVVNHTTTKDTDICVGRMQRFLRIM